MITVTRQPNHVRSQRYSWHHDRIGRLHASGGFTYTRIGAWIQSIHHRAAIRHYEWRRRSFGEKHWRFW